MTAQHSSISGQIIPNKEGIVLLNAARRRSDDVHRHACNKTRPYNSNPKVVGKTFGNKEVSFVRSGMRDFFSFSVGRTALT